MGVIIPGEFKVVHTKRYFALNVFALTRFHCTLCITLPHNLFSLPHYATHTKSEDTQILKKLLMVSNLLY